MSESKYMPEIINAIREKHGFNDRDIALHMGINRGFIWMWRYKKRKIPAKYMPKLTSILSADTASFPLKIRKKQENHHDKKYSEQEKHAIKLTYELIKRLNKELTLDGNKLKGKQLVRMALTNEAEKFNELEIFNG